MCVAAFGGDSEMWHAGLCHRIVGCRFYNTMFNYKSEIVLL